MFDVSAHKILNPYNFHVKLIIDIIDNRARIIDFNYSEDGGTILFATFMYTYVAIINLNKYYDSICQEITGQSVPVNYIDLKNILRP